MALDALFRGAALERGIVPSLPRSGKLPGETGFRRRRAKNRGNEASSCGQRKSVSPSLLLIEIRNWHTSGSDSSLPLVCYSAVFCFS